VKDYTVILELLQDPSNLVDARGSAASTEGVSICVGGGGRGGGGGGGGEGGISREECFYILLKEGWPLREVWKKSSPGQKRKHNRR